MKNCRRYVSSSSSSTSTSSTFKDCSNGIDNTAHGTCNISITSRVPDGAFLPEVDVLTQSTLRLLKPLAVIIDGNGRWAEQRGASGGAGHLAVARALRTIVTPCATIGLPQLLLYACSSDTCRRPTEELQSLLTLFTSHVRSHAGALAGVAVQARHRSEVATMQPPDRWAASPVW